MRLGRLGGALVAAGIFMLGARGAGAVTLDFDALTSLTDVAAASLPGVTVSTALVVSESDANLLTGFDTSKWATSDANGIFNTLAPSIQLDFSTPVTAFSVSVVGLPDVGGFQQVLLQAFRGGALVGIDVSDPAALGDSGFAEALLAVAGTSIDRVVLSPVTYALVNGVPCFDLGDAGTFFADDASFTPVPEPASALLVLLGLAAAATRSLRRGIA
jgi:hypothetical protein